MKIYQIGGSVRDKLMGRRPQDIDYVVVGASVAQMLGLGYKQVGRDFPVFINPEDKCEYALARKEIKTGCRHGDFRFVFTEDITLAEDIERRDFTCNALALDPESGQIIDYHDGQKDIAAKILRHINDAHFPEDPLRVLRLCRFAAQLGFTPASETLLLCRSMVAAGMLQYLSAERIWQEVFRALQTEVFESFITTARSCGALKVILPEVEQLFAVPEKPDFHPEGNSGDHTLLCLKEATGENARVKFAVLLHDIGKIMTPADILPSHRGHDNNGVVIIQNICRRLKVPNEFRNFAVMCARLHMQLRRLQDKTLPEIVDLAEEVGFDRLEDFLAVCRADIRGRAMDISEEEQQNFARNSRFLRQAAGILKDIRAKDMPDFADLPKDQNFAAALRRFKAEKLKEHLSEYCAG